jgi:hypothetical protein
MEFGFMLKLAKRSVRSMPRAVAKVGLYAYALLVGTLVTASSAMAQAPPLIPDTGLAVDAYITEAIVAMAVVAGVVVGGYFAFLIIKKGMSWGRKAL